MGKLELILSQPIIPKDTVQLKILGSTVQLKIVSTEDIAICGWNIPAKQGGSRHQDTYMSSLGNVHATCEPCKGRCAHELQFSSLSLLWGMYIGQAGRESTY